MSYHAISYRLIAAGAPRDMKSPSKEMIERLYFEQRLSVPKVAQRFEGVAFRVLLRFPGEGN